VCGGLRLGDLEAALDDLKTFETWRGAPIGSLVKVKLRSAPTIGMRCQLRSTGGQAPMDFILALAGEHKGKLLRDGNPGPAFDISNIFDLVIENPMGDEFTREHWPVAGLVCEMRAGSGILFIRTALEQQPLYIWLRDPQGKAKKGEALNDTVPDLVAWGMIGIALKRENHQYWVPDPVV
jgi:hypothetical protein